MTPDQAQDLQQQIVAEQPSLFVRACPGAGKTRLVVDRFLLVGQAGSHVAVLSFTNKAADEIADRSSHHGDPRLVGFPNFVGTFDRLLATFIVRPFGQLGGPIQIVDSWESVDTFVRAAGIQREISLDHFEISPNGVLRFDPRNDAPRLNEQDRARVERIAERQRRRLRRSSRKICALAATLRDGPPDHAVNDPDDDGDPVHLLSYPGQLGAAIGERFADVVDTSGISRNEAVVLAHRANTAARVVGAGAKRTSSILAAFARANHRLQDRRLSPVERHRELGAIDRLLLRFVGADTAEWTTRDAIDRHGVDETWLRSAAMEMVSTMATLDIEEDCDHWTGALRASLRRAGEPRGLRTKSPNVFLKTPKTATGKSAAWLTGATTGVGIRHSTIHAAKGTETDAVLTVIPRDQGQDRRTADLIQAWKNGRDCEPRRVLFVAITRARRLSALAIPQAHLQDVQAILATNDVTTEVHDL